MRFRSDWQARVAKLREQIAALKDERSTLDSAPVPKAEAYARIDQLIAATADHNGPSGYVLPRGHAFTVQDYQGRGLVNGSRHEDALGPLLAWLFPDVIRDKLRELVDAEYGGAAGVSEADRNKRLSAIYRELFELEVEEERAITAAEGDGVDLPRRPDADPAAILEA